MAFWGFLKMILDYYSDGSNRLYSSRKELRFRDSELMAYLKVVTAEVCVTYQSVTHTCICLEQSTCFRGCRQTLRCEAVLRNTVQHL